jgi:hypothetical protein
LLNFFSYFYSSFSTYFSSLESLIITNVGAKGENCFRKPHNVSSSPFPIVVAHFNASKTFQSTSLSFPKISLFSQNIGGLDASGSM